MRRNEFGRLAMYPAPEVRKAKICFVGDYPTMDELKAGQYFLGDPAEVLKRTLAKVEIPLNDCYLTNACDYLISKKSKNIQDWDKQRKRVLDEIRQSEADIVVPLGALATGILLNSKAATMKKVLGNLIDIPELPGKTVIPNYHPSVLMHQAGHYKVYENVMRTIALYYRGGIRDPGKTTWEIAVPEKLDEYIEKLEKAEYVGIDIESSSLNTKRALFWVMGISYAKNKSLVFDRDFFMQHRNKLQKLLLLKCKYVWHNGKYDTELLAWRGVKARLDEDTILLHYCTNETSGTHGLGQIATLFLGADEYKSKMNSEFNVITDVDAYKSHRDDLIERVAIDADYTRQVYEKLKPIVSEHPDWSRLYDKILMPGSNFLRRVQMNGCKMDVPYLCQLQEQFSQEVEDLQTEVEEAAAPYWDMDLYKAQTGAKSASEIFKPTSPKQMAWMVYDRLQLKPTKRKKRSTDEETLESIENPPAFVLKVLELRKAKKKLKTYVTSYLEKKDEKDLVHTTFNLHITATGRLSSTEPNIQNVPSSSPLLRRSFIPRAENRILMEVDYSGAELRVLAWISQDEALIKAVTEGDMHSEVAANIFGPNFTKLQRGIAKTVNFGIAYGRGANDLHNSFPEYSLEECQGWIEGWAKTYPKAWAYLESCIDNVKSNAPLTTIYGRHRRFGLVTAKQLKSLSNEAKNFRIQSISSDNCFLSAMEAEDKLRDEYDSYVINLIHDSILLDVPADPAIVKAVSQYMSEVMMQQPIKQFNCNVPFKCDTDLGPNWGDVCGYDNKTELVSTKNGEVPYVEFIKSYGISV